MPYDLLIRGGRIVDGSGMPSYPGDVAVKDGQIVEVGSPSGTAKKTINADGMVVSPGFIDHHTHMDAQILWDPYATSEPQHGITSIVMGNCGLTLAPVRKDDGDSLLKCLVRVEAMNRSALELGIPWTWRTFRDYLDTVGQRIGVNVGGLVGHVAIRQHVLGEESTEREATTAEITEMQQLAKDALEAGALGISTNRNQRHMREDGKPLPSKVATDEETMALAGVLRELNTGVIETVHETPPRVNQIEWYERLAEASGRPVVWQAMQHRWDAPELWSQQMVEVERAFREGKRIYATTNTSTIVNRLTLKKATQFDEFPTWRTVMFLPLEARKQALADTDTRNKMRAELAIERPTTFHRRWDLVHVVGVTKPANEKYLKKNIKEVAEITGKEPLDAFLDLALDEDLETTFRSAAKEGDPELNAKILQSDYVLVGVSDAGAHTAFQAGFGYCTTLLGRWVRERAALTLEQAVHRLTFQVASIYDIRNRGLLRPGYAADLAIFDPDTVASRDAEPANDYPGGAQRMIQPSVGVQYTIVNGQPIYEDGKLTANLPGNLLRGAAYKAA